MGAHVFIGGLTGINRDVIPFVMAAGNRAGLAGINVKGLRRRGFDNETIHALHAAYEAFFFSAGSRAERLERVSGRFGSVPAVRQMIEFIRASGERPMCLPRQRGGDADA